MQKMLVKNNEKRDISLILFIIYLFHLVFIMFVNNNTIITDNKMFKYIYIFKIYRWLFSFPIIYYFVKNIKNYEYFKTSNKLNIKNFIIYFAIFFLGIHILNILNIFTITISNLKEKQSTIQGFLYMDTLWTVFISPVLEEIVFRGVIMNNLKKYGIKIAIIVNSIFFAFSHYDIEKIMPVLFMGIILSYITYKYSLKYSIIFHFFMNLLGIIPVIIFTLKIQKYLYIYSLIFIVLVVFLFIIFIRNVKREKYKEIFSIFKLNNEDRKNIAEFVKNNGLYLFVILVIVISNLLFNYKLF